MKKQKIKLFVLLGIVLLLVGVIFIYFLNLTSKKDITAVSIDNVRYTLEKGETFQARLYDDNSTEVNFRNKDYYDVPVIYNGISLGDSIETVIEAFEIKSGFAYLDMEVPSSLHGEHGETDVISTNYKNTNFIKEGFLYADISFYYKKTKEQWNLIKVNKLESLNEKDIEELIYVSLSFSTQYDDISEPILTNIRVGR